MLKLRDLPILLPDLIRLAPSKKWLKSHNNLRTVLSEGSSKNSNSSGYDRCCRDIIRKMRASPSLSTSNCLNLLNNLRTKKVSLKSFAKIENFLRGKEPLRIHLPKWPRHSMRNGRSVGCVDWEWVTAEWPKEWSHYSTNPDHATGTECRRRTGDQSAKFSIVSTYRNESGEAKQGIPPSAHVQHIFQSVSRK